MEIWFCWERGMTGQWAPVCYHGEKPKPEKSSADDAPARSVLHSVPGDCVDQEGNALFGRLCDRFPAPQAITAY